VPIAAGVRGGYPHPRFHYIVESLGLDGREVFNMYNEVDSIRGKDEFVMRLTESVMRPASPPLAKPGIAEVSKAS
jgi:ribonucleoside-diphosphate reductase beta chain